MKLIAILSAATVAYPALPAVHSLEKIEETAADYVRRQDAWHETEIHISTGPLDRRLRLPLCDTELEASAPHTLNPAGYTTINVRCNGSKPWSILVPVKVQVFRDIAVAERSLPASRILTSNDLRLVKTDVSRYAGSYVTDTGQITGRQLTRPVQVGQPISPHMLKSPVAVRTGDKIRLLSRSGAFEVSMEGESLMNGAVGDRIRVRNTRSKRIVEGKLMADGTVLVN